MESKFQPEATTSSLSSDDDSVIAEFTAGLSEESQPFVEEFALTQYELELLAAYYLFLRHRLDFLRKCGKQLSERETAIHRFAQSRLAMVSEAIGEKAFSAVASPIEDWWIRRQSRVVDRMFGRLEDCKACRTPLCYVDAIDSATKICRTCRLKLRESSEELRRAPTVDSSWLNLIEVANRLEEELQKPTVDWQAPTGPAADRAIGWINTVLSEFPSPETASKDPIGFAMHRFIAAICEVFGHDLSVHRQPRAPKTLETINRSMPTESEGLGPMFAGGLVLGSVPGVNDESSLLVDRFQPIEWELTVLANHYYDKIRQIDYEWRVYATSGSYEIRFGPFADRRVATIADVIGEEKVEAALAASVAKWKRRFDQIDEEERSLSPCRECGEKRAIWNIVFGDDGCCDRCESSEGNAIEGAKS